MSSHSKELVDAGCPLSGLCQDLDEEFGELMDSADSCMKYLVDWSTEQFRLMGMEQPEKLGFEFVARIEGVILLGNILRNSRQLKEQFNAVADWVENIDPVSRSKERAAA
ncbi:MAG: hypothetical protein OXE42_00970 [Gammaproteobacteria bacterium]|nr:hypothetical protein [Gammaproteobacteria bacterium]